MLNSWCQAINFERIILIVICCCFIYILKGICSLCKRPLQFLSIDDKHKIKIGEPGFPVAAAERGKRVIVSCDSTFQVGDHDFTRMGIVPSVCLSIDIPENLFTMGKYIYALKMLFFNHLLQIVTLQNCTS